MGFWGFGGGGVWGGVGGVGLWVGGGWVVGGLWVLGVLGFWGCLGMFGDVWEFCLELYEGWPSRGDGQPSFIVFWDRLFVSPVHRA